MFGSGLDLVQLVAGDVAFGNKLRHLELNNSFKNEFLILVGW